jgi:hypothetical protein
LWILASILTYSSENWTNDRSTVSETISAAQPNSGASPNSAATSTSAATPNPAVTKPPDPVMPKLENGHFVWRAFDIAIPVVHVQTYTSGAETRLKDRGPTTIGTWRVPVSPGFFASLISCLGWIAGSLLLVTLSGVAKRE